MLRAERGGGYEEGGLREGWLAGVQLRAMDCLYGGAGGQAERPELHG